MVRSMQPPKQCHWFPWCLSAGTCALWQGVDDHTLDHLEDGVCILVGIDSLCQPSIVFGQVVAVGLVLAQLGHDGLLGIGWVDLQALLDVLCAWRVVQ